MKLRLLSNLLPNVRINKKTVLKLSFLLTRKEVGRATNLYFEIFRLMIFRWSWRSAKLAPIAATNDKAVFNFKAKKIKLKNTIKIQKQAIFTKNKISFKLELTGASSV